MQLKDAIISNIRGRFDERISLYRLPVINAVAGSEVHGFRKAPLTHVHFIIQRSEQAAFIKRRKVFLYLSVENISFYK